MKMYDSPEEARQAEEMRLEQLRQEQLRKERLRLEQLKAKLDKLEKMTAGTPQDAVYQYEQSLLPTAQDKAAAARKQNTSQANYNTAPIGYTPTQFDPAKLEAALPDFLKNSASNNPFDFTVNPIPTSNQANPLPYHTAFTNPTANGNRYIPQYDPNQIKQAIPFIPTANTNGNRDFNLFESISNLFQGNKMKENAVSPYANTGLAPLTGLAVETGKHDTDNQAATPWMGGPGAKAEPEPSPSPYGTEAGSIDPMYGPAPSLQPVDDYEQQRTDILNDIGLSASEQDAKLAELDKQFNVHITDTGTNFDPGGIYDAKLKEKIKDINRLKQYISDVKRLNVPEEGIRYYQSQLDEKMKEFGTNVPNLDGDTLEADRLVDIQLDNKDIGNARYANGKATGNLDDVVTGLGGRINWSLSGMTATVRDAEGNEISTIKKYNNEAIEKDKNGNIINIYKLIDGNIQADVSDYAKKLNVPLSYYHDKNGVFHAYTQPEMRDGPIQVVRKEDQLYIDAYINFDGDINDVKAACDSIKNMWNGKTRNISGMDGNNNYLGNDTITLHTTIHGIDEKGNPYGDADVPKDHRTVTINLDKNSKMRKSFNWSSHVFTVDPKEAPIFSILSGNNPIYNLFDAFKTGEWEKIMYNWTIKNPGQMWLYNPDDAAHEFGHLLGLGDAYAAFYRNCKEASEHFEMPNEYGDIAKYKVPKKENNQSGDVMRSQDDVSDADVALLTNLVWRNGSPYYFNKSEYRDGGETW